MQGKCEYLISKDHNYKLKRQNPCYTVSLANQLRALYVSQSQTCMFYQPISSTPVPTNQCRCNFVSSYYVFASAIVALPRLHPMIQWWLIDYNIAHQSLKSMCDSYSTNTTCHNINLYYLPLFLPLHLSFLVFLWWFSSPLCESGGNGKE